MPNPSSPTLLPQNSSAEEHALDGVSASNTSLDFPNAHLFNPDLCPESLLGHLAWALSVEEWDDAWDEIIKRQICRVAIELHRFKGTKHAIVAALNSLNVSADVNEWFEDGGQAFTATLVAFANDNLNSGGDTLLTPALQEKLWRVVSHAKNARTHIDFKIGVNAHAKVHVAAASSNVSVQRNDVRLTSDYPVFVRMHTMLAGMGQTVSRQDLALV